MLIGMLLGVLLYRPFFRQLYHIADPQHKTASAKTMEDRKSETLSGNLSGSLLTVTNTRNFEDGSLFKEVTRERTGEDGKVVGSVTKEMVLGEKSKWQMIGLITIMVLFVTMVYGPVAAFLVELFPTKIRYTSMSLPYHIGNGVFGGLVPFIATLITTIPDSNYLSGLWYPIGVAAVCLLIGALYLSNARMNDTESQNEKK